MCEQIQICFSGFSEGETAVEPLANDDTSAEAGVPWPAARPPRAHRDGHYPVCGELARRARARAPRRPIDRHCGRPHTTRGPPSCANRDGRLLSEPERRPLKNCLGEARRPNPRRGRPPRGRAHGPVRASRASVLGPMIECRCADSEHCAAAFSRGHPSTEAEGLTMRRPQGSRRLSLAAAAAAAAARRARGRRSLRAIAGARGA